LHGNPQHRPLNMHEPVFTPGAPERPEDLSDGARRFWDALAMEMARAGVLGSIDGPALAMLCEDMATLDELRKGLNAQAKEITAKAKENGQKIVGNAMTVLSRTTEGRRTLCSMRELTAGIVVMMREFGATPAARTRIEATGTDGLAIDPLERALCQ
jgi:phage terminase small subunit